MCPWNTLSTKVTSIFFQPEKSVKYQQQYFYCIPSQHCWSELSEACFLRVNAASTEHRTRVLLQYDEVRFTQNFKSCFRASYSKSFLPHGSLPERVELGGAGRRVKRNKNEPTKLIFKLFFFLSKRFSFSWEASQDPSQLGIKAPLISKIERWYNYTVLCTLKMLFLNNVWLQKS